MQVLYMYNIKVKGQFQSSHTKKGTAREIKVQTPQTHFLVHNYAVILTVFIFHAGWNLFLQFIYKSPTCNTKLYATQRWHHVPFFHRP
jgi:hypothetical protein